MSKNIVDATLEYVKESTNLVGFIPSRRQVDYNGGYVNKWTTGAFTRYVANRTLIQRDHGGEKQGFSLDNGRISYMCDSKHFNSIHVDPWKASSTFDEGTQKTIDDILYIHSKNENILYEVGTEESIEHFTPRKLRNLLLTLKKNLPEHIFTKIRYAVVQSGVGLDLGRQVNTGKFSKERLSKMQKVCDEFSILSKEHNGDYLSPLQIKNRFDIGLSAINIAPELGQIETECYIEEMKTDQKERFFEICHRSDRWRKWVKPNFKPEKEKERLIKICGHYVFSENDFLEIKPACDAKVVSKIKQRLEGIFNEQ